MSRILSIQLRILGVKKNNFPDDFNRETSVQPTELSEIFENNEKRFTMDNSASKK